MEREAVKLESEAEKKLYTAKKATTLSFVHSMSAMQAMSRATPARLAPFSNNPFN
jgi:hypothetical protein